jgi:hypothetical protein
LPGQDQRSSARAHRQENHRLVAPQLSEHTAEDAVLALENLLKQAVSIRDLALQQEAALAELEDKIAACERSGRDAQDVIARFQTLALVDSLDALRTAIAQSERLRALQSESEKVSASLIEEGDGLTLDALSEECADAGQAAQFCLGRGLNPFNRHKSARSKISAGVGATLAAGGADEARFDVRQPDVVRPAIGADLDVLPATMIAAIDKYLAHAGCAHFAEGDFSGAGGHSFSGRAALSKVPSVDHRIRLEGGVAFRQPRTCRPHRA